jgi:hypothetical protein
MASLSEAMGRRVTIDARRSPSTLEKSGSKMSPMRKVAIATALAGGLILSAASAGAQPSDLVQNPMVKVDYVEPFNPAFFWGEDDPRAAGEYKQLKDKYLRLEAIRQRLQKRRLLEEFSQFLAPVKLPVTLRLIAKQCNEENAFFSPTDLAIHLCYEFIDRIERRAPKQTTPEGITRQEAIIGPTVGVLLHESGHALSRLLQLPVLGREEDTADQIAAFIMLQFGGDVARTLIKGQAYDYNFGARLGSHPFWDNHSSDLQRQHIFLCAAYGKDRAGFQDFVDRGWLPKARAPNCEREYNQIAMAFKLTVEPHLNMDLVKKVQQRRWLRPEDAK